MKLAIIAILVSTLIVSGSCYHIGAAIMSIPAKQGKEKWRTDDYRLTLKQRQGWAGPSYYKLRFKEKGLGHRRIKTTIGPYTKQECIYYLPVKSDSIRIDFCTYMISYQRIEKLKIRRRK